MNIEEPYELLHYLRTKGFIKADENPTLVTLGGGVSNRTVLVKRPDGEAWVLKQGLSKLRVEADWYCSPERVHREALGLQWLSEVTPSGTIPKLVFEDQEKHLLAMEAVPEPHRNWKQMLMAGQVLQSHVLQFSQLLAGIHEGAAKHGDRLKNVFGDHSYFEALRLEPYYACTAERVSPAASFYERLLRETRHYRLTLVHGDYSPKNILVYRDRLILLDHEVVHFGDPAFDLGFSLTHLLSKAHHLKGHREEFLQATISYWRTYSSIVASEEWAKGLESRSVRHTLGCLLARVAGRSPLEYFSDAECARQKALVVSMMENPPEDLSGLIQQFSAGL